MNRLLSPRWMIAHVGVVIIAIGFVNLGFWQLRRLEERKLSNAITESRYQAPPEELSALIEAAGADLESLHFRRAFVTGTFDTEYEVLTRSQVYQGQAGFHVVDPLRTSAGKAVLVNRGWVPLILDEPPVTEAAPPTGEVTVAGWISSTQSRPALGHSDPEEGTLKVMSRVDIDRIEAQMPYELAPVYLVVEGEQGSDLPIPLDPPSFSNEGSHLAYAIQWFGFTIIGLVGYFFLIRRQLSNHQRSVRH